MHKIKKYQYGSTITPGAPSYPLNGNYAFQGVADFVNYPATALGGVMETTGSNGAIRGLGAGIRTLGGQLTSNIGNEIYKSALANSGKLTSQGVKNAFSTGLKNTFSGSAGLGFGMGAAGTVLSAIAGPKSEYEGLKGGTTQALDTAYDGIATGLSFIPGGQVAAGAMTLAKGVGDVLGSLGGGTDGMTDVDSVLGSSFFNWNIGALNGFGGAKTHKLNNQDFMNQNKLDQMWSGYADALHDNLNARTKSGKKYGMFSNGARKRANKLIDTANMNQEYLLDMQRGTELGSIRGNNMASINSIRYNQALYGGVKPVAIGKSGLKISDIRNIINTYHSRPKSLSIVKPLELQKDYIDKFQAGGKPKYVRSDQSYYDPETDTIYYSGDNRKTRKEAKIHEEFHRNPNKELLEFIRPQYENLNDDRIVELGGDLDFVKRFDGDPQVLYDPIEIGARLVAAYQRTKNKAWDYSEDFFEKARQDENKYGDNFRDLLRMYNNKNLAQMFSFFRRNQNTGGFGGGGGTFRDPNGEIGNGMPLKPTGQYAPDGQELYESPTGELFTLRPQAFKQGGQMNLIPEGSLHARLHHMEDADGLTKKGIPVVDNDGNQQAEIEVNEIIFRKEVTDKLEELAKDGSNKAAEEAGRLLVEEIFENTDDRTGLIEEVTGKTDKFGKGGSLLQNVESYRFSQSPITIISDKERLELQKKIDQSQLENLEGAHDLALVNTNKTLQGLKTIGDSIANIPEQIQQANKDKKKLTDLAFSQKLMDSKYFEEQKKLQDLAIAQQELEQKALKEQYNPQLAAEGEKLPENTFNGADVIRDILSLSPEKLQELQNILKYLKNND